MMNSILSFDLQRESVRLIEREILLDCEDRGLSRLEALAIVHAVAGELLQEEELASCSDRAGWELTLLELRQIASGLVCRLDRLEKSTREITQL